MSRNLTDQRLRFCTVSGLFLFEDGSCRLAE